MWFVKAIEPDDAPEPHRVEVFGPFNSDIDAKAFAIDLWMDNGWESSEAVEYDSFDNALQESTDKYVHYPYKES